MLKVVVLCKIEDGQINPHIQIIAGTGNTPSEDAHGVYGEGKIPEITSYAANAFIISSCVG